MVYRATLSQKLKGKRQKYNSKVKSLEKIVGDGSGGFLFAKSEILNYIIDMSVEEIIKELKKYSNPKNIVGMARFGITGKNVLGGPSIPILRKMAKEIIKSSRNRHELAQGLWASGIHEAKILAGFIDNADEVTEKQMEDWVKDFDSWDVCDQVCCNLFDKTGLAWKKVYEWSEREEEFVKRAAFSLIAGLAWHNKEANDDNFIKFLPIIKKEAEDERNFVKKAVNWALRQIGKRNNNLRGAAIRTAEEILKESIKNNSKSGRWIANDALRELNEARR